MAADLTDLGVHEVALCARTPFEALTVEHPGGTSRVDAAATTDPADATPANWVLLATKAHQSAGTRPWLHALCAEGGAVAVLQNGVDHEERVAPLVPAATRVLPVVVQLPAEKTAPGRVAQSRDGLLWVPDDDCGRAFAGLFDGARTTVRPTGDFLTQAWWKLVSNAALGGVCVLALRENGAAADPELRELVLVLMEEVVAVARAEGANLPEDAARQSLDGILGVASEHWSSISVDRREGRPMEWAARNAVVGRRGRVHGVPTPMNDAVTTLLRAADAGTRG